MSLIGALTSIFLYFKPAETLIRLSGPKRTHTACVACFTWYCCIVLATFLDQICVEAWHFDGSFADKFQYTIYLFFSFLFNRLKTHMVDYSTSVFCLYNFNGVFWWKWVTELKNTKWCNFMPDQNKAILSLIDTKDERSIFTNVHTSGNQFIIIDHI